MRLFTPLRRVKAGYLVPLALLACSSCSSTPQAEAEIAPSVTNSKGVSTQVREKHDGRDRGYFLHIPPSYDGKTPVPLVLGFHGLGGKGTAFADQAMLVPKSDKEGFIVCCPDALGSLPEWHEGNLNYNQHGDYDIAFVSELIDNLSKKYKIDANRIYACGCSNGAAMVDTLAARLGDKIAAVCAAAGSPGVLDEHWNYHEVASPQTPISVMSVNGVQDTITGYNGESWHVPSRMSGSFWARKLGCGPTPSIDRPAKTVVVEHYSGGRDGAVSEFVTYEAAGHGWPLEPVSTTDLMWDFFKQHPKHAAGS